MVEIERVVIPGQGMHVSEPLHSCSSPSTLNPAGIEHNTLRDAAVEVMFPDFLKIAPQLVAHSLGFSVHRGFVLLFPFEFCSVLGTKTF